MIDAAKVAIILNLIFFDSCCALTDDNINLACFYRLILSQVSTAPILFDTYCILLTFLYVADWINPVRTCKEIGIEVMNKVHEAGTTQIVEPPSSGTGIFWLFCGYSYIIGYHKDRNATEQCITQYTAFVTLVYMHFLFLHVRKSWIIVKQTHKRKYLHTEVQFTFCMSGCKCADEKKSVYIQ